MKKLLAKSNGINLIDHSKRVKDISLYIAYKLFPESPFTDNSLIQNPEDFYEIVRLSALLHDIGKATKGFQKVLQEDTAKSGYEFLHHEISWAFLQKYLNVPSKIFTWVTDIVYWHHGIRNKMCANVCDDIINNIKKPDIEEMKNVLVELLGKEYIRSDENEKNLRTPAYYYEDGESLAKTKNSFLISLRMCVYSADKIVSFFEETTTEIDIEKVKQYVDQSNIRSSFEIQDYPVDNKSRFYLQKDIVEQCTKTSIPKAPAGFGKTLLGLLWASKSNHRLIWVCPRNSVAESVFHSIVSELETTNINASVELYLTSEIKKQRNITSDQAFQADIIVTNIDSFLAPTIDARHASKLFLFGCTDVVFDEFHELCNDSALMSAFITMMNLRHNYLQVRTLLLSATPLPMSFLWDSEINKTTILPNTETHYPAAHQEKYTISFSTEFDNPNNSISFYNSISASQINKNKSSLIHSYFEETKKNKLIEKLYAQYGKKANAQKENWVSTHVIQASFDLSFDIGFESVMSPESSLQRLGRINRWGTNKNKAKFFIINSNENSEKRTITELYNTELKNKWYDFLNENIKSDIDLNELYELYNGFYIKYHAEIKSYLKNKYNESLKSLVKVYPIKIFNSNKSNHLTAGSNKLRSAGNEIFFIVKHHQKDSWTSPFSTRIYRNFTDDFNESEKVFTQMKGVWNNLKNDPRFNFNELLENKKTITHEKYQNYLCKKSDTPYIRFDQEYHEEYGLIKLDVLEKILKN